MTVQAKSDSLLWIFREELIARETGEVDFDPADAIYRLYRNTRNPFLQRAIAPPARKLERSAAELSRLFRVLAKQQRYQVSPTNAQPPFERRQLSHPPPPPAHAPKFQEPADLPGHMARLPWLIEEFFRSILARLRADSQSFYDVVEELVLLFRRHRIKIRLYRAYEALQDWDDLMDTLEEIARYPSVETFDLFASALFTYYELVSLDPAEG